MDPRLGWVEKGGLTWGKVPDFTWNIVKNCLFGFYLVY